LGERAAIAADPNVASIGFYDIITLIFHYHYQWNKQERQRNEVAIREHLIHRAPLVFLTRAGFHFA
jgi:hypothetical protein